MDIVIGFPAPHGGWAGGFLWSLPRLPSISGCVVVGCFLVVSFYESSSGCFETSLLKVCILIGTYLKQAIVYSPLILVSLCLHLPVPLVLNYILPRGNNSSQPLYLLSHKSQSNLQRSILRVSEDGFLLFMNSNICSFELFDGSSSFSLALRRAA